jgi:hypothetical protein
MLSQTKPDMHTYERERIVFETIQNNPELHHNALIKQIVPKQMAKTTFEKTKNSLLEKEIIQVEIKGNMKFYHLTDNYELKFQQHIERNTHKSFHDLKLNIKKLKTDFQHKDIDEKIVIAVSLLCDLFYTDNGFTVLDAIKNPKKTLYRDEHLLIQQLIHEIFKVVKIDQDFKIIFPTIITHMGLNSVKKNI